MLVCTHTLTHTLICMCLQWPVDHNVPTFLLQMFEVDAVMTTMDSVSLRHQRAVSDCWLVLCLHWIVLTFDVSVCVYE